MAGTIDQLIVCSPYEEPDRHWQYDRESRTFTLAPGRRPAGYVVATAGSKSFDDPGMFVELPLVNRIRPRVRAWRDAGYPGVTGTTLRLLQHWRDPEAWEERRFFFCQLEALETLIWLIEAPPGERQGIDVEGDGGPFSRVCAKMATGSGKTLVMAKTEIEEATRWIGGLDRIHRSRGILRCYDFSATPFAPSGKESSEEALFGWIVSDFSLNDASSRSRGPTWFASSMRGRRVSHSIGNR